MNRIVWLLCLPLLMMMTPSSVMAAPKKVRVLLWSEQTEPRAVYPTGISGALADYLNKQAGFEAKTAALTDSDLGISDAVLAETDVLVWFGHRKHNDVPDEVAERVTRHVRERGMGFIALHSAHFSKPLKKLLNNTGAWSSYVNHGQPEQMWVVLPQHPIAKGITDFEIPKTEIYTEPFEVPEPEAVILEGTWAESGHRGREVMTWTLDKGRMVYIRAGHEEYPIFFMPQMQKIVENSTMWAAGRTKAADYLTRREAGPAATATGPHKTSRQYRDLQKTSATTNPGAVAATTPTAAPTATSAAAAASAIEPVVLVLNKYDDTIDFFNTTDGTKLSTIKTGTHPHEVAVSPDGAYAYVTLYGTGIYGKNPEPNNKLAIINLRTRKEEAQIDLSPYKSPHGIAVDPQGLVWLTCETDEAVIVVDPKAKKVLGAVPTGTKGTHWVALVPDGSKAYTSNKETTRISVINTNIRKVIKEIAVPRGVEGIGVSPDGKRLYAGDFGQPILYVIDTQTDEVIKQVTLKHKPGRVRVTPDNRHILISSYDANAIEVVDTKTLASSNVVPVGKAPMGITFSPNSRYAMIANSGGTTVSVIDLRSMEVVLNVTTGSGPDGIAYASPSRK